MAMASSVASFSSTTSNPYFAPPSESLLLKRRGISECCRGSVSFAPSIKCSSRLLAFNFQARNTNFLQVSCSIKTQAPVIEARSMDEIYDALAERLVPAAAAAAAANPTFKHIVGIAGSPGSGKTTVATEVARRVNKLWAQKSGSFDSQVEPPAVAAVLGMDGFHLYRHQLDAMEDPQEAHARRGAPWTFDPDLFLNCLKTLRNQGSVYAPSFDHGVGDPIEDDIYISLQHKVVIVEGNYLLLEDGSWKDVASMFDEKWFIEVDLDTAMKRVLKRHISTGKPEDVAKFRVEYNDRPNAELISKTKKHADLVIKSINF